jgi:phenylalanyl-tRNA synthetase beta chain
VRFSHAWLADYVVLRDPPPEVGRRLTAAGVPLEGLVWPDPADPGTAVYDFDVFTNRPDCMNHQGLAREIAALTGELLRLPQPLVPGGGKTTSSVATVGIENPEMCARYSARCILGARVGPSPEWLRHRLESIGQRSINNVVDATNYVLWEMGHPLHPFDLDRLSGRQVVVRTARAGESLVTLDGEERRLDAGTLVIADARGPVALAGVMGGQASEIGSSTRNILLESAWFDPVSIRRTSKALGLHTDASHRFERGADPGATLAALDRAAMLVTELAGGEVTDPAIDQHPRPEPPLRVPLRPARVRALLGIDIAAEGARGGLERLGFAVDVTDPARWAVQVPSFRRDITREVDLIEEIARQRGYDAIPSALPVAQDAAGGRDPVGRLDDRARAALLAAGLSEAVNFAMADRDECLLLAPETAPPAIENPLQSGAASLRTTLLPGLLRNTAHNLNRGVSGCHLFEVGHVFTPAAGRPAETLRAAGVLAGRGVWSHWSLGRREVDLFDARGAVEFLAERLGMTAPRFASDTIARGAVAGLRAVLGDGVTGIVGEVSPAVLRRFEIDRRTFVFEVGLEGLHGVRPPDRRFAGLPRFPAVRRDLAVVVRENCTVTAIEEVIRGVSSLPIAEVQVFDRYRGKGVEAGCASVALQVVFQHPERTLAADEVQAAQDAIVTALQDRLGARLRGSGPPG